MKASYLIVIILAIAAIAVWLTPISTVNKVLGSATCVVAAAVYLNASPKEPEEDNTEQSHK